MCQQQTPDATMMRRMGTDAATQYTKVHAISNDSTMQIGCHNVMSDVPDHKTFNLVDIATEPAHATLIGKTARKRTSTMLSSNCNFGKCKSVKICSALRAISVPGTRRSLRSTPVFSENNNKRTNARMPRNEQFSDQRMRTKITTTMRAA